MLQVLFIAALCTWFTATQAQSQNGDKCYPSLQSIVQLPQIQTLENIEIQGPALGFPIHVFEDPQFYNSQGAGLVRMNPSGLVSVEVDGSMLKLSFGGAAPTNPAGVEIVLSGQNGYSSRPNMPTISASGQSIQVTPSWSNKIVMKGEDMTVRVKKLKKFHSIETSDSHHSRSYLHFKLASNTRTSANTKLTHNLRLEHPLQKGRKTNLEDSVRPPLKARKTTLPRKDEQPLLHQTTQNKNWLPL